MVMSSYRSEPTGRGPRGYMEIVYSVLSVCLNGALKTHVMFRCNLNSKQLHFYIESLLAKGLLEKEREPPSAKVEYRTTNKGRKYLETYGALLQMLNDDRRIESESFAQAGGRS
jgi:predicted transcriptional regulator